MKYFMMFAAFAAAFVLNPVASIDAADKCSAKVVIPNVQNSNGNIQVAFFNSEGTFPQPDKGHYILKAFPLQSKGQWVQTFSNLKCGENAISLIHDANANRKIDVNFMGIPTEAYGVSNNNVPSFSAPKYGPAVFSLSPGQTKTLTIRLKY